MSPPNHCACPLCLSPDTAELRIDRRGRPYLRCWRCESTAFIRNPVGLTSVHYLAPHASALFAARGLTLEGAQEQATRRAVEAA